MFLQALEVFCLNAHVWPASGSTSVAGLPACDSLLVGCDVWYQAAEASFGNARCSE